VLEEVAQKIQHYEQKKINLYQSRREKLKFLYVVTAFIETSYLVYLYAVWNDVSEEALTYLAPLLLIPLL
jgi:EamA domain-containing membrane protein RarD